MNKEYLDFVKNTKFLSNVTKEIYFKKIKEALELTGYKNISELLKNPERFAELITNYAKSHKGRTSETLGPHFVDSYFSAIISLFIYNQAMQEKEFDLFNKWKSLHSEIRKPINEKYKSNVPTKRQEDAYVPYNGIVEMRDSLPIGSPERLLLSMYTEIPPVRSDYYKTRIFKSMPKDVKTNENFIVLNEKPILILEKYKTVKTYGVITIDIPEKLKSEIEDSLRIKPREYLFVSSSGKPYEKENSFNRWANRTLQSLFNKGFTLSMLRHIYISRRDLKLEEKSGLVQDDIAKLMGHSVEQQRRYLWHTWLKKTEIKE